MSYEYQPKFPKAKLHEIVSKYIAVMLSLGKGPNCSIAFAGSDGQVSATDTRGWLLKDSRPGSSGNRFVLLADGDVWYETSAAPNAAAADGDKIWLEGPHDDLVTLLARSQANVRMGGDGFFELEEHVQLGGPYVVGDRRAEQQPYPGPERRSRE